MPIGEWLHLYLNLTLIGLVDAISPVRVALILVLLSGKRPVVRSSVFIAGIGTFSFCIGLLITESSRFLPTEQDEKSLLGVAIGLLLGLGLLFLAFITWRKRSSPATQVNVPTFLTHVYDLVRYGSLIGVFVGGMIMQLFSLKSLILFSIGLKEIYQAGLHAPANWIATLFLIAIMLSEMIVPTVVYAASPENSAQLLNQMNQWLQSYSYTILAIFEAVLAIYFLVDSLMAL